jgi:GTPase SAR1 family protein
MLDVTFVLQSHDERIAEFVRLFWEPFLAGAAPDGEVVEVSIDRSGDRWTLRSEGRPLTAADDPWVLGASLRNLLTLRAVQGSPAVMPLHSSVVEKGGVHVVLTGQPMAGKTTLTLALLERGWRYVSDDMAPIDAASALARPFRKALSIRDPARWETLAPRWQVPGWLPAPSVVGLVPAVAFEWSAADAYRPGVIVFPQYLAGAAPVLEPLTTARAMVLCGENLHDDTALKEGGLARLATWAGSAATARIEYGSTEEALELLGNCLAGLPGDGIIS